jgi:hypothetical protein
MSESQPKPDKPKRVRAYRPKRSGVSFGLPREFEALCEREGVRPLAVLQQFIGDLCDMRAWTAQSAYAASGDAAHRAALAYHQVASRARKSKAQAGAALPDVATPRPAAETRATTPIEALAAAALRERKERP